jgi:hypothetical protein
MRSSGGGSYDTGGACEVAPSKVVAAGAHPKGVAPGKGGGGGFDGSGRRRQEAPVTGNGGGEVLQHEG